MNKLLQDPSIDNKFVPKHEMYFKTAEDALEFYRVYASLAGFGIRRNRKRNGGRAQEVECTFSGAHRNDPGPDRVRDKTTKRKKCRAKVTISRATDEIER